MNPLNLLRCPCCAARLVSGPGAQYETLAEHCCDPDGDVPVRSTLVCPYRKCATHTIDAFWTPAGEGPYCAVFGNDIRWIDGSSNAIGSWHRNYDFKK